MIEIQTKFDLNALKQLLIGGVIFSIVLGTFGNVLLPKLPYSTDIGGYLVWFIIFGITSIITLSISMILITLSGTIVKRFIR